jgi:hypothetical protein
MMDEKELEQRLHGLFMAEPPMTTPPHADIERGRARVRRGRAVAGLASAAVVATIVAGAAVLPGGNAEIDRTVGPSSPSTQVTADAPTSKPPESEQEQQGDGYEHFETRQLIYAAARKHLDPDGKFLDFSRPHVFTSSSPGRPAVALATTIGWQAKGEKGLGRVHVGISNRGGGTYGGCGTEFECQPYTSPDGIEAVAGQATDGSGDLHVLVKQADGETVDVYVGSLWGNNSLVPTKSLNVTIDDAIALAADERLDIVD